MTEKTFDESGVRSYLIIFYALAVVVLIYTFLLVLLEIFVPPTGSSTTGDGIAIFPFVAGGFNVILFFIATKVMLPKIRDTDDPNEIFVLMLVNSVLVETIGILALLIGILDLFVINQPIQWGFVAPYMLLSGVTQFFLIQQEYTPKLKDLIGTTYEVES